MKYSFSKTNREDVLIDFITALYRQKCGVYNDYAPMEYGGHSSEDIEDGIAQTHNMLIKLLREATDE